MNVMKGKRLVETIDQIVLMFMVLGIIFLFQPFSMKLFTYAFPVLLVTYALHSVLDHF